MPAQPTPSRMEAFSDGVIAVIITIMVLEFKVPREPGPAGLLTIVPTFAVYALSFTVTGIYWVNHHHLIDRLKRVDALILWLNLLFLFFLSLLPFFTNYLIEHHLDSFATAIYAASFLLDGLAYTLLGQAIIRRLRLAGEEDDAEEAQQQVYEQRKGLLSIFLDLVAIAVAYWRPYLSLASIALVAVLWIVPNSGLRPRQVPESPAHDEKD